VEAMGLPLAPAKVVTSLEAGRDAEG